MVKVLKPHTIIVYGSDQYPCFDVIKKQGIKVVAYPVKNNDMDDTKSFLPQDPQNANNNSIKKSIDISAPIIPYVGMGGIKLYTTREELKDILNAPNVTAELLFEDWIRYDIGNEMALFFHIKNDKLYQICTKEGYLGSLDNGINVNTKEEDYTKYDPNIIFDEDDEETWKSPLGYWIETDFTTCKATWISVHIKELEDYDEFQKCNW